jgi:hypothetical protein
VFGRLEAVWRRWIIPCMPPSPKSLIRYSFMTKGVMTEAGYTLGSVLGGSVVHRKCRVGILHVQRVDVVRSCTLMSPFSAETR